jgi:hypothetical protein
MFLLQTGSTSKLYHPPGAKFIVSDWGDIVDSGIGLTLSPPVRDYEFGFWPLFNFEVTNGFTTPSDRYSRLPTRVLTILCEEDMYATRPGPISCQIIYTRF